MTLLHTTYLLIICRIWVQKPPKGVFNVWADIRLDLSDWNPLDFFNIEYTLFRHLDKASLVYSMITRYVIGVVN